MTVQSSVDSRTLGARATLTGEGDCLANITTTMLDDGARCYVTREHAEFQLHRDSAASPDGTTIIEPIAGPGRWIKQTGGGSITIPFPVSDIDATSVPDGQVILALGGVAQWGAGGLMSGVGLTGEIVPLNGGNFPVFQDIRGKGGWRCVATIADRNSFSAAPLFCKEGMICYVDALQCAYELAPDLVTWIFYLPSPRLAAQSDWYVDAAGSALADGKLGNPIPFEELQRRLWPDGTRCMLTNDVIVHVATATYTYNYVAVGSADGAVHTLTIACQITSTAPTALLAVVQSDAATKTRGEITVAVGTVFVPHERVRLVSGASVGAMAYSTGLHASPQNTYVSGFNTPSTALFHTPTPPAVGDLCVIDTLTVRLSRIEIDAGPGALVVVKDANIIRAVVNGSSTNTPSAESGGNVTFAGCCAIGIGSAWQNNAGGANFFSCRIIGPEGPGGAGTTVLRGDGWLAYGTVAQGNFGVGGACHSYGLCIDGGHVASGVDAFFNVNDSGSPARLSAYQGYNGAGGIEVQNGPGIVPGRAAVTIAPGSAMQVGVPVAQQWGASTAYAIGYTLEAASQIFVENLVPAQLSTYLNIPSTVNVLVGGLELAYSDNPIWISNASAGIIAADYGAAGSLTDGGFYRKNQSANVGPTGFVNLVLAGQYRVTGYVATTTQDAGAAGTPTLNVIYTDDSGVAQTKAVVVGPSLTTLSGNGNELIIESNGSTQVQWSLTGIVTPLAARCSVRCRIEYVAFGP